MALTAEQLTAAYEHTHRALLVYCAHRVGEDAEDVAAQVWLEAVERAPSYEDRGYPVSAWLYRIAHSRCTDLLRQRERRRPAALLDRHAAPDAYSLVETCVDLAPLLAQLHTDEQRAALLLRAQGEDTRRMAHTLETSDLAIRALLHRARRQLRALRDGHERERW